MGVIMELGCKVCFMASNIGGHDPLQELADRLSHMGSMLKVMKCIVVVVGRNCADVLMQLTENTRPNMDFAGIPGQALGIKLRQLNAFSNLV